MDLKYQTEISNRNFKIQCPISGAQPTNLSAFRFVYSPITHNLNFLPNIIFDNLVGIGYDYDNAPEQDVCLRCGISLYDTITNAKKAWKKLAPRVKQKLGYSHLAKGVLTQSDGLMNNINDKGHFGFYEDNNANLIQKFTIVEQL